jgi:hypothetical protein
MYYKLITALFFIAGMTACSKGDSVSPNSDYQGLGSVNNGKGGVLAPFGTWKMIGYEDNVVTPYDISIEIKNEKNEIGQYIINGKSHVNFYFAFFRSDFEKRTMAVFGVGGTKIKGSAEDMRYEEDYWLKLSKVERYEISDNGQTLTLHLPEKDKQKITYKLIK